MWLRRSALAAVTLGLVLASGVADAAGRRVINNYPVATTNGVTRLPMAIADATSVYSIVKLLPQARVANALTNAMVYGGAAAVIAQLMLDQRNAADGGGNITYNSTTNNFYYGEEYSGSWRHVNTSGLGIAECDLPSAANFTHSQAMTCTVNSLAGKVASSQTSCAFHSVYSGSPSSGDYVARIRCNPKPGYGEYNAYLRFARHNAANPAGYSAPAATQQQLADAVRNYSNPYNHRDFWEPYPGASDVAVRNITDAAHEPLKLTTAQQSDLQNQLATTCNAAGDLLVYELCLMGKDHGVKAAPPATDVPEAQQTEQGTTTNNVVVNVPADTPGNAFQPVQLDELDGFAAITQNFWTALEAAPIVAAWSGLSASMPAAACPSFPLTVLGNQYDLAESACPMWEGYVAPFLTLFFLFAWPFWGLRYIFSA